MGCASDKEVSEEVLALATHCQDVPLPQLWLQTYPILSFCQEESLPVHICRQSTAQLQSLPVEDPGLHLVTEDIVCPELVAQSAVPPPPHLNNLHHSCLPQSS